MTANKVYLCGPISGLTYDEAALDWRQYVWDKLYALGIPAYSPMRGKGFLRNPRAWIEGKDQPYSERGKTPIIDSNSYDANPVSTTQAVLGRDRFDTQTASVLFCNLLGAKTVSIGSMVEFGWADSKRIPIVLVMEKIGNCHDHLFVKGLATYWVHSLDEGIELTKMLLTPGY